ncbi:MAG: Gfo/Idh/MocA family oxidoreductase [Candidatus Omnitrophica bacterium]|nr:Gfo/Idh/MocA family oxidoreductase [Candidatus Omnitrophota bacterium]
MQAVRLGLIGAGWIARQHLEALRGFADIKAVAIVSRTRSKAEALAAEYGIPAVYDDLDALVAKEKPDALMVLVSEENMFSVASQAIQYGLPLFIEKPAGLSPEDNLALAEMAEQRRIPTMAGYNRRYYSIFHKGIEIIRQHGELLGVSVEGHERMWRVREGKKFSERVMLDWIFANSTHTIDLLRFFGGEVRSLKSIAHRRFGESRGDQFAAVMELSCGAVAQYTAHWYSPGGWRVVLYGDGVTVEFKPLESGRWTNRKFETVEIEPEEYDKKYKAGFWGQMRAFGELVRTGRKDAFMLDLRGAYETMRLAQQISLDAECVVQK